MYRSFKPNKKGQYLPDLPHIMIERLKKIALYAEAYSIFNDESNRDADILRARERWPKFVSRVIMNDAKYVFNKLKIDSYDYDNAIPSSLFRWLLFLFWTDFYTKKEFQNVLEREIIDAINSECKETIKGIDIKDFSAYVEMLTKDINAGVSL